MKMNQINGMVAAMGILLMASCGTTKLAQKDNTSAIEHKKTETTAKATNAKQSSEVANLSFVQKVYDNQVYAKNIVGKMSFNLQAGGKDITVPGKLSMRKDEVIRIQLFIPILGSEVGRLEFTPNYVLIIDRLHKEHPDKSAFYVDQLRFLEKLILNSKMKK